MASPSHVRVLSLGFMLIVLCMHHCSARKVLMEDMINKQEKGQLKDEVKVKPAPMAHENVPSPSINKQEKSQPMDEVKPAPMAHESVDQKNNDTMMRSKEGEEIGLECGNGGCDAPCYELPCNGVVVWPQPPPYVIIVEPPPTCTPCEPWYGPGPCPCPCEEEGYNAETEGIKTEGRARDDESNNKAMQGGRSPLLSGKERSFADAPMPAIMKTQEGGAPLLLGKERIPMLGLPLPSFADAPMPAIMDGSNVHA